MKQIFVTCMLLALCAQFSILNSANEGQDLYLQKKQRRVLEQEREAAKKGKKPSPQEKRRNRKKERNEVEHNMRQDLRYQQR